MTNSAQTRPTLPQILLAEDSDTSATLIARHLQGRFDVLHARDGAQALQMLIANPHIEVLITDIQMPVLDGHALLRKIRASDSLRLRELPVLAMTALTDEAERERAFASGASDFLTKPVNALELQARVGVYQKLSHTIRELEASRQQLQEQATTDPLTKLKNRRAFAELGLRHFSLAQRHDNELSLVIIDIDNFKKVNDTYGHPVGDQVLVSVAQVLASKTRAGDIPARIGGEEFAILLPNTRRTGAALLAERIRAAIEEHRYNVDGRTIAVTASAGVAAYGLDGEDSLDRLVEVADKRLYVAKQQGRNRVVAMNAEH